MKCDGYRIGYYTVGAYFIGMDTINSYNKKVETICNIAKVAHRISTVEGDGTVFLDDMNHREFNMWQRLTVLLITHSTRF